MQRIDDPSNMGTRQTPLATVSPGYFRRPSVLAGDQGTIVTGDWANDVQETLVHPILAAGLSLVKGADDQLTAAIATLASSLIATHYGVGATEGVTGHARFANAAEVLAQASGSLLISPLRLKQAFPASAANPGYIQLPTLAGNLVVNFGTITIGGNNTETVTLARAYSSAHLIQIANPDLRGSFATTGNWGAWANATNPLTQIDVRNSVGASLPFSWLSIGL